MSTANKPVPEQNTESYCPKEMPAIIYVAEKYCAEKINETIVFKGVTFEVIEKPDTFYAGKIAYASNLTDEPDIGKLLNDVKSNDILGKVIECIAPGWDVAISIDYWQGGAVPRGMMFAKETTTNKQPDGIDIYKMPKSMFMRVFHDKNAAKALGRESCEIWDLFGLMKETVMPQHGYKFARHGAQEMEYYNWQKYGSGFAYVPVERI